MSLDTPSPLALPSPWSDVVDLTPAPSRSSAQSLRDSCDNCYKAKIKCSKTKPECDRCVTRGFQCVYLPSRRRGRTKAMTGRRTSQNSPARSRRDSMDRSSQHGSIISSNELDLLRNTHDLTSYAMPEFPTMNTLQAVTSPPLGFFASSESAHTLFSEPDLSPCQDFLGTKFNKPGLQPSASADLGLFTPPISAQATPDGRKQNTFSPESFTDHLNSLQCDCMSQCLNSLNVLYSSSASWDCPPPFDVIITVNTWATNQCSSTLNCLRCFSREGNSSLAMLLGTLLKKILAYYQAAILGTAVQRDNNPVQLMLGSFTVDAGAEQRLELDILRPELQRLQPLLGRFSDFCERIRDENSTDLFQSLPESLENDLLNMTRLIQQQNQRLTGQGFAAQTFQ